MSSSMVAVCPETENIGLLEGKVPMFCLESTEVCLKEVRCFVFPNPILQKKVLCFSPTFLHQSLKFPLFIENFRWRIGCRILLSPGAILHPQHRFDWLLGSSGKSCFSYESQIPTIKSLHSDAFPQVSPRKRWKAEQFHTVSGTES